MSRIIPPKRTVDRKMLEAVISAKNAEIKVLRKRLSVCHSVLRAVLAAEAWDDPGTHEHKTIAEWLDDPDLRALAESVLKEKD